MSKLEDELAKLRRPLASESLDVRVQQVCSKASPRRDIRTTWLAVAGAAAGLLIAASFALRGGGNRDGMETVDYAAEPSYSSTVVEPGLAEVVLLDRGHISPWGVTKTSWLVVHD